MNRRTKRRDLGGMDHAESSHDHVDAARHGHASVDHATHPNAGEQQRVRLLHALLGAVVLLVMFAFLTDTKLWRPEDTFNERNNSQISEAISWWAGRLDLPERMWDTALKDGKVYNHFPPMFTMLAALVVPLFGGVPHWLVVLALALPVPLLAYRLFLLRTSSVRWSVVLALGFVFGTSVYPVLDKTLRGVSPYMVNETIAVIGLLLMLIDGMGRRRVWPACIGLVLSTLSRQLTFAYAIPLVLLAWGADRGRGIKHRVMAAITLVSILGVIMTLNTLKFGHPLDSGYMHMYNDRPSDFLSRDARTYGLFAVHYLPRNLYHTHVGLPRVHRIQVEGKEEVHLRPNRMGTGIWWTTPLLLWLLVDFRRLIRDPNDRYMLIAAGVVMAALMLYQNTGYEQRGFNRYSLDYLPVVLGVIAPRCIEGRRKWISLAMIAWSVAYFRWLI